MSISNSKNMSFMIILLVILTVTFTYAFISETFYRPDKENSYITSTNTK